jgi:hypothetical protein
VNSNKNPGYKPKPANAASSNTATAAANDDIEIVEVASSQPSNQDSSNIRSKNYSTGNSGGSNNDDISITAKPQSNFVNNVTCLNRLLTKNDLYASKLRRCKPYSSLRPSAIVSTVDRYLDGSDDEDGGGGGEPLANRKVIVIDDSNEEMHKPWISADLIKLIKQRNLLQEKLNESKTDEQDVNEELMKKFKNLRNKVCVRFIYLACVKISNCKIISRKMS